MSGQILWQHFYRPSKTRWLSQSLKPSEMDDFISKNDLKWEEGFESSFHATGLGNNDTYFELFVQCSTSVVISWKTVSRLGACISSVGVMKWTVEGKSSVRGPHISRESKEVSHVTNLWERKLKHVPQNKGWHLTKKCALGILYFWVAVVLDILNTGLSTVLKGSTPFA